MSFDIVLSLICIMLGFYGLVYTKNLIKSIVCLNIIQTSIILLFLKFVDTPYGQIPIALRGAKEFVDPLPQALMITTIVIGASITALALMFTIKIFHHFGTLDWNELMEREE